MSDHSNNAVQAHLPGPARETSYDAAAAIIRSGSVASYQVSCNMPGVIARAMTQAHEIQLIPMARADAATQVGEHVADAVFKHRMIHVGDMYLCLKQ
jgi:hypothetical protein